jgi:hypothetical protein
MAANESNTSKILDLSDELTTRCTAARAIMDAAKVLTALRTAIAEPIQGTLATGEGWADGYVLHDRTLPDLLSHGASLMDDIEKGVEEMHRLAIGPVRELKRHG